MTDKSVYTQPHPINDIFQDDPVLSKSQATKLRIIEGAIRCYIKYGIDHTTYQKIAKASKCSFALTKHYFPDPDELFEVVNKYIRSAFQRLAVAAIMSKSTTDEQLRAYIESTFVWTEKSPDHARVWIIFFFKCSISEKSRKTHSELTEMGHRRISALLKKGREEKYFHFESADEVAKHIQTLITGAIMTLLTENVEHPQAYKKSVLKLCLSLVQQEKKLKT